MFYRSGWLRCVAFKYVVFGSGLCFERLMVDVRCYIVLYYILYIILLYLIHILLLYILLLSYTILFCSSLPFPIISYSSSLLFLSLSSQYPSSSSSSIPLLSPLLSSCSFLFHSFSPSLPSHHNLPSPPNTPEILVGTYIYLFIFYHLFPFHLFFSISPIMKVDILG